MPSRIASARALECRNTITIIISTIAISGSLAFLIHSLLTTHHKPGLPGDDGANGAIGPTGDKGNKGPVGPRGVNGSRGSTGNQGPPGPAGSRGEAGHSCWDAQLDGLCNATDDKNNDGQCTPADCRGPQGVQGPVGDQGIQGVTGPTGGSGGIRCWDFTGLASTCNATLFDANRDGECNVSDCTGAPCDPAFNVTTCVGPIGLKGLPGDRGPRGAPGVDSVVQGVVGSTGPACWDRNQNFLFDIGSEDFDGNGSPTASDCRGTQGANGPNGANGANGVNGAQGPAGPKGDPGDKGETGALGDTGPPGPKGAPGDTGPTVRGSEGRKCWDTNDNNACDSGETITGVPTCSVDSCVTPALPLRPLRYTITLPTWFLDHWVYDQNYTIEIMSEFVTSISAVFETTITNGLLAVTNAFTSGINGGSVGYAACWNNYFAVADCPAGYTQGWPTEVARVLSPNYPNPRAHFCTGTFTKDGETVDALIGIKSDGWGGNYVPFLGLYMAPRNGSWTVPYNMKVSCTLWWARSRFTDGGQFR